MTTRKSAEQSLWLVAAGVRGPYEHRFCAVAILVWGHRVKDEDNSAKRNYNSDCHYRDHGERQYESTQ
jgi:hypothetical protein